ncbi:MAG TPA: hybrid sensor histidine kinase/response regulator [Tepidiformaceae bacterium]
MESGVKGTVLIVDDDPALLDALPRAVSLRMPGLNVTTAPSAYGALELIEKTDFDVVVTDIKMPGLDGLGLLEKINSIRPGTPTILITGHGEHELTIRALRGGAYDFVQKPIDRDYFSVTLNNALQTRALMRQVSEQEKALADYARELEARVEQRTRQLQTANDVKDEFLGMISHEMRTPLTVLTGGVNLLLGADPQQLGSEDYRALLGDMSREGERLVRIVEDLLVMARAGLDFENMEPARIERLLESIIGREQARTGRVIRLLCAENLPLVAAEPTYVERVVENLLSNAHKYSLEGAEIDISVRQFGGSRLCITVEDRGGEISPEQAERFFRSFYRAPETRERVRGFGIGLTVCRRLVGALGGEIWASPRDGGGLQVSFTVPIYEDVEQVAS